MAGPVRVPSSWIKDAPYDPVQEMLSVVQATFRGTGIQTPFLGSLMLLELCDNSFFLRPEACSGEELGQALFIFHAGKDAVPAVVEFIHDRPEQLQRGGEWALLEFGDAIIEHYADFIKWAIEVSFSGLAMIPDGGETRDQFVFNAVTVCRLLYLAARYGNLKPEEALWKVPLATLGHLIACGCDADGVKGVARPKDPDDIRRQLLAAKEREERGEKHPWQN